MDSSPKNHSSEGRERIAILDPQPVVRTWISGLLLSSGGWLTAWECGDAESAMERIAVEEPDLLITELRLQDGLDGLFLVKSLLRRHPDLRVLFYSAHSEEFYAERCLRAGAMGYLHKNDPSYRLEEAVEDILHGELSVNDRIRRQALRNATGDLSQREEDLLLQSLTDRELEILMLLGKGHSFRETARRLGIAGSTVQVHAGAIRRKLSLRGTLELLAFATRVLPLIHDGMIAPEEGSRESSEARLSSPELVDTVRRFVERYP